MPLAQPFVFRISCRIFLAKAHSPLPSFRFMRSCWLTTMNTKLRMLPTQFWDYSRWSVSIIVLAGVLTTPYIISGIAPGFKGETRELTIRLVRILFPGAGLLVLSAWCLGVLNSHHRFFISYTAPVAWNLAMIASLVIFGRRVGQFPLAVYVAWGSVIGSALQFGVQLPVVFRLVHRLRPALDFASVHVRTVIRNFFPCFHEPWRGPNQRLC